jgi:predicted esterase
VPVRTRSCSTSSAARTVCRALAVAALIAAAGCGADRDGAAPPPVATALHAELSDFGPAPAVRSGPSTREPDTAWLTFRSVLGGRVPAYLVEPKGSGPFPGVVFQHGRLGNRSQFLGEARHLRAHGIASLLLDAPWARPHGRRILTGRSSDALTLRQTVVDERRALDVLAARPEIDPRRLGVMGFSLGAVASAALLGVYHRVRCGVLASAGQRLAPLLQRFGGARYLRAMAVFDPTRWIGGATAQLLVQNGRHDRDFPPYDALARIQVTDTSVRRMYPAGHTLDARAVHDRERWLEGCLG